MIELDNGKWAVRLHPESTEEAAYLRELNRPEPIGYLMHNNDFLVMKKYLSKIMETLLCQLRRQ